MGDAGSGLLGYAFGTLALASERRGPGILIWALLLGTFGFDATITLLRRATRGERWSQPHQMHAYQRLARSWGGHLPVTVAFGVVNLALAGLAAMAVLAPERSGPALAIGVGLLVTAYLSVERVAPWPDRGLGR